MKEIKYNWAQEKKEFMTSEFPNVKSYFEHKYGKYNRYIAVKTAGWKKNKIIRDERRVDNFLAALEKAEGTEIVEALESIRTYFKGKVVSKEEMAKLSVKAAKIVWEVLRTECNLPTRVTQNFNADKEVDYTTVRKELLEKLKNKKKKK